MENISLQKKLTKLYAKWLCLVICENRTCKTKGYCIHQKRFDKIKETINQEKEV